MKSSVKNIKLASYEDIFKTDDAVAVQKDIREIPLREISDFKNHPFHVRIDEELAGLAESVQQNGVIVPALIRPKAGGGYEMISGHRRKKASEMAGLSTMPCYVREMDDDTATIFMVDSNRQRENILPSEKAFAYKMQLDAITHQGQRSDLSNTSCTMCMKTNEASTSCTVCTKSDSGGIIAERYEESRRNIYNYIRLKYLIHPFLDMVDKRTMPFRAGVNLSYLSEENQKVLFRYCSENSQKINLKQSLTLKTLGEKAGFINTILDSVFLSPSKKVREPIKLPFEDLQQYFGEADNDEIAKRVLDIVRLHYEGGG